MMRDCGFAGILLLAAIGVMFLLGIAAAAEQPAARQDAPVALAVFLLIGLLAISPMAWRIFDKGRNAARRRDRDRP